MGYPIKNNTLPFFVKDIKNPETLKVLKHTIFLRRFNSCFTN